MSLGSDANAGSPAQTQKGVKNVVLVHGGFVDGSGWQKVYGVLKKDGYNVTIVQNPTTSLADDVAFTKRAIAAQDGPVNRRWHRNQGTWRAPVGDELPRL